MHSSMYVNAVAIRALSLQSEFFTLYYVEVGLTLFSANAALVALYLVHTVRAFHFNLTLMFTNLIIVYLISVPARFTIIAYQFEWLHQETSSIEYNLLLVCSLIRHHLMGTGVFTFVFIAVERWLATILVTDYERKRRHWISVLLLSLVNASSALYSFLFSFEVLSGNICVFGLMTASICGLVAFVIIYQSNLRHLQRLKTVNAQPTSDTYSLSLRYQLNENIVVSKMLFVMCAVATVGTLAIACLFLVPFLFLSTTTFAGNLLHALVDYVIVIYTCLLVVIPAGINDVYRRAMLQLTGKVCCWHHCVCGIRLLELSQAPQVVNQFTPQQETDYYFDRLQNAWNKVSSNNFGELAKSDHQSHRKGKQGFLQSFDGPHKGFTTLEPRQQQKGDAHIKYTFEITKTAFVFELIQLRECKCMVSLDHLPADLLLHFLSIAEPKDVIALSRTSHRIRNAILKNHGRLQKSEDASVEFYLKDGDDAMLFLNLKGGRKLRVAFLIELRNELVETTSNSVPNIEEVEFPRLSWMRCYLLATSKEDFLDTLEWLLELVTRHHRFVEVQCKTGTEEQRTTEVVLSKLSHVFKADGTRLTTLFLCNAKKKQVELAEDVLLDFISITHLAFLKSTFHPPYNITRRFFYDRAVQNLENLWLTHDPSAELDIDDNALEGLHSAYRVDLFGATTKLTVEGIRRFILQGPEKRRLLHLRMPWDKNSEVALTRGLTFSHSDERCGQAFEPLHYYTDRATHQELFFKYDFIDKPKNSVVNFYGGDDGFLYV